MAAKHQSKLFAIGGAVRRVGSHLVATYGTVDPRSLGAARIGLGLLLLHDLARRVPGISSWYSNEGLLPNHTVLWRPSSDYVFSVLLAASRPEEVAVFFALFAVVYVLFTLGWHTRLFHVLSLLCLVSLHDRSIFLENGGDVALNLLCVWTLFLPMGRRFSIDAVRRSLAEPESKGSDLQGPPPRAVEPVASIAVLAILLQVSVIYYFNAVNKHGWTWREGLAVHYVLYQERMVTWFGVMMRALMTPALSRVLSYTVLAIEVVAPLLLLSPIGRVPLRRAAIVLYPALHLAFASSLNLGQFSFNMMGYFPLLLSAADWDALGRRFGPKPGRARMFHIDETSALGCAWARLLTVLDTSRNSAVSPRSADPHLLRGLARRKRFAIVVRELGAAVLLVTLASQLLVENRAIPQRFKVAQPSWMTQLVAYPRLMQGWQMFAADVPTGERMLYVDAVTVGGRHVDPYNEAASRVARLPIDTIPPHLEQDEFWCDYTNRIPDNEGYWRAFKEWIFNYHHRTGHAEDRIVSFEARLIEVDEPAPGEVGQKNVRNKVMLSARE